MTDMPDTTVTLRALRSHAAELGELVSREDLKTLRREGLMPEPVQRHVIGRRGSESHYPAWAKDQLTDLIDLRRRRRQRPYTIVRFIAWEEGLWVEHQIMRTTVADLVRHSVSGLQRTGYRPEETLADRVETGTIKGEPHPMVRALLGDRADEDRVRDLAFDVAQMAAQTEDAVRAVKAMNDITSRLIPSEIELTDDGVLGVVNQFGLPPAGQWPRIISRCSRAQLDRGKQLLTQVRLFIDHGVQLDESDASIEIPGPEMFEDDSIKAIRYRAAVAAPAIVAANVNPESLRVFETEEE